jgi:uncharacterized cupredoxin-like copper-binding protein
MKSSPPYARITACSATRGLLAMALAAAAWSAHAHGERPHARPAGPVVKEQKPWGIAAEPKDAQRTVRIDMDDRMRFTPDRIEAREGETLRIEVRNRGRLMHELVLGTEAELREHAELMKKFPDMEHDEPYMAHVDPGKTATIVWTFNRLGEFWFGCLLPGHFEAGMVGRITVVAR